MPSKHELMSASMPVAVAAKLGYDPFTTITAGGSSQNTATPLVGNFVNVITPSSNNGVRVAAPFERSFIFNSGPSALLVYPSVNGTFVGLTLNAPTTVTGGNSVQIEGDGTWFSVVPSGGNSSLTGVIDARTFGAKGDGVTDDTVALQAAINAAFIVATSNAQAPPVGNKTLYIPPGNYKTTAPLLLTGTFGVVLTGAGRFTTQIINSAGTNVFITQGCQYSLFKDMLLQTSGSGVCFDLTWDGINNCALQSNTFQNMQFGGGSRGVRIGIGGFMGSENTFLNCFWSGLTVAGLSIDNANALQNEVFGGNFEGCATGILVNVGSVPAIVGVGFQTSTNWDIDIEGSANDCYHVAGCRTESTNFANFARGNATVSGCTHTGSGTFVASGFHAVGMYNCISTGGQVDFEDGEIAYCEFGRPRSTWATARHTSVVRGTYLNGTIDSTGYIDYLFHGEWSSGVFYNMNLASVLALTDAASITTDASSSSFFTVTLAGNRTLANPTNLRRGIIYQWVITQGAGGNHTLAYGNLFTWPAGSVPTLSTAAAAVDMISATYDGTALRASIQKGFA